MKSNIIWVCTLAMFFYAGAGCNKSVDPSAETGTLEQLRSQYEQVGEQHNESLDYVLESFDQLKGQPSSQGDILDFVQNRGRKHVQSRYESAVVKQVAGEIHDEETDRLLSSFDGPATQSTGGGPSYFTQTLERPGLQNAEKQYIERLGDALESSNGVDEAHREIDAILVEAEETLTEEELRTVVISAEVAVSSVAYWNEQGPEWKQKIRELTGEQSADMQQNPDPTIQYRPWVGVAKSDIAGAVGGIVGSAVTGCAQLSFGACAGVGALAGGLGASASTGARYLLDAYWSNGPVTYPKLEQQP